MGIVKVKCDRCEITMEHNMFHYDEGSGMYLCDSCFIKVMIENKQTELNNFIAWLQNTHFKRIRKIRNDIIKLKEKVKNEE